MNNTRRKQISDLVERIESIKSDLEDIQSDEEMFRDNMPENLHESEKFWASETASETMEEAVDNLSDAVSNLEDI